VEDIVQTVFMKAYSKLSSYRGDAPFEHWLMRTATFTCYDFLRKHQRNREWNATDLSTEENEWLENVGEDTTEKEANQSAAKALVDRLLESLKPDDRMIITMLDLEQKSVKEIAKLTDFTESNVKVRAHRAREKMKKILATLAPEKYL
jgi:RNA polymerase sigma-70 factor (ECF subfamily)